MPSAAQPPLPRPMAERRRRILAAARALVAARGYEGLTMRELAERSRVTVPTLYNLIGGKEAVLAAAVEEQTARFLAAIERRPHASPAARLLAVVDACTRELLGLPAYYRTLLHLLYTAEAARPVRARVDRALADELAAALAALAEAGELAAWAEPRALLGSLRSQLGASALAWAAGALSDLAFPAEAAYQASLTLLGVTTGRSRLELERAARAAQPRLRTPAGLLRTLRGRVARAGPRLEAPSSPVRRGLHGPGRRPGTRRARGEDRALHAGRRVALG